MNAPNVQWNESKLPLKYRIQITKVDKTAHACGKKYQYK